MERTLVIVVNMTVTIIQRVPPSQSPPTPMDVDDVALDDPIPMDIDSDLPADAKTHHMDVSAVDSPDMAVD